VRSWDPYDARWAGGSIIHPSSPSSVPKTSNDITARLTRVLSASAVNEVAYSWGRYWWQTNPVVNWPNHPQASAGFTHGTPRILLRGYTIGQAHTRSPQDLTDGGPSVRDDLSFSFVQGGRHDIKTGAEYIHSNSPIFLCINCGGTLDAQGANIPSNVEALFPVYNDVSSWNLNGLISPATEVQRVRFYQLAGRRLSRGQPDSQLRDVDTGRLDARQADDEPRGPLRLHQRYVGRGSAVRSMGAQAGD
jgi:hypothetical protein